MINWIPLHCHSEFSLKDAISKAKNMAKRCVELGYEGCGLTDHGSISGCVKFFKEMTDEKELKKTEGYKGKLKPFLGNEFYICGGKVDDRSVSNRKLTHLPVVSYNEQGWRNLMKLTSMSNRPEHFYHSPRLDFTSFKGRTDGLVAFSGHAGSHLADCIFTDPSRAYSAKTYEEAINFVASNYVEKIESLTYQFLELFGKNFYYEIQLIDVTNLPCMKIVASILREECKKYGIKCIATPDAHYIYREDAIDQRIVLASTIGRSIKQLDQMVKNGEDFAFKGFFESNSYHIPTIQELLDCGHLEDEIENTMEIGDKYQSFNLLSQPRLPDFPCPEGFNQDEYFLHLIREGWKKRGVPNSNTIYADRVKEEIKVLTEANLQGYFLIVQDYVNYAKNSGILVGTGRGSVAGSLVAYLLGITEVDPIPYNLLFSRFYNAGRNSPGKISMPDIDIDFPKYARETMMDYIKNKYGYNKVMQIATFGRMQGKAAIKEVLRCHDVCTPDEMNDITKHIPDESKIMDELQEMKDNGIAEPSILMWTLENKAEKLSPWVQLQEDGTLTGDYAQYFEQAIRIEGIKQTQGKHAAGLVVSPVDLYENYPLLYDKQTGNNILGVDMVAVEMLGLVKMDILALAALDKIQGVRNTLLTGNVG